MKQACPFCGTDVDDSAEEIRPGVRLCPTCGQEVDEASQPPDPAAQQAGPVPPPPPPPGADGQTDAQAQAGPTDHTPAWEMDGGSWLDKLWRTIWQVLLHPVLTFSAPGRIQKKAPLIFALIVVVACKLVSDVFSLLASGASIEASPITWGALTFSILIGSPISAAFGTIFGLFIFGGLCHLFLMLFGGARGGFSATFRVLAYASAIQLFWIIVLLNWQFGLIWLAVVGGTVFVVWQTVILIAGLAATHGVSLWRPFGAMAMQWLLLVLLIGGILYSVGPENWDQLMDAFNQDMHSNQL